MTITARRTVLANHDPDAMQRLGITVNAEGTSYAGSPDAPFSCRPENSRSLDWLGLDDRDRSRELEDLGVTILTANVHKDPDVRYVQAVATAILDNIQDRKPTWAEIDTLRSALFSLTNDAAAAIARPWLLERGSIPLTGTSKP